MASLGTYIKNLKTAASALSLSEDAYFLQQLILASSGGSSSVIDGLITAANDASDTSTKDYFQTIKDSVDTIASPSATLVLADAADLAGTYDSNIVVTGSATISANLVVNGSLYVTGDLTNTGGFGVTTLGDWIVSGSIHFTPTDVGIGQSSLSVGGSFRYGYFEMYVNAGENDPTLTVNGDFASINYGDFYAQGHDGQNGMTIYVGGDALVDYVSLNGGSATSSLNAGNGGTFNVFGSLTTYDGVDSEGGASSFDLRSAGSGGSINVNGDCVLWSNLSGGAANAKGNGGNGGSLYVDGDLTAYWVSLNGGDCASTASAYQAGQGGHIECYGNIGGDGPLYLNGGYRSGTLEEQDNGTGAAQAGYVNCSGDVLCSHIEMKGGTNDSDFGGNANSPGGNGGQLTLKGDAILYVLLLNGGNSRQMDGGAGGSVSAKGRLHVSSQIQANGGSSVSGANGSAGTVIAKKGVLAQLVQMLDGTGLGTAPTSSCGLSITGAGHIGNLDLVDRAQAYVNSNLNNFNPAPATLQIGVMTTKKTLNQPNGDATADISTYCGTSLFMYDTVAGWTYIQGAGLGVG